MRTKLAGWALAGALACGTAAATNGCNVLLGDLHDVDENALTDAGIPGAGCTGAQCLPGNGQSSGGPASCSGSGLRCANAQPQRCVNGVWQSEGPSCSGSTPVCTSGVCGCARGSLQCASLAQPQKCDDSGQWQNAGPPCGSGMLCGEGVCTIPCTIQGAQYPNGTVNPLNACQTCQPSVRTSDWTTLSDGTQCGTGKICHTGACLAECEIMGAFHSASAPNPSNRCESCQPTRSTSSWSGMNGASCGTKMFCQQSTCITGCYIDNAVYASSAPNPTNGCETCQQDVSTSTWTGLPNGASCGAGKTCSAGACCAGGETPCGGSCCMGGQTCCGSVCCTTGQTCCGGVCCNVGQTCATNVCCNFGETPCNGKCCSFAQQCSGGTCH